MAAIVTTELTGGRSGTQVSPFSATSSANTDVVAPTKNALLLLSIETITLGPTPNIPTVTGVGLTWVLVYEQQHNTGGGVSRQFLFRALGVASPGTVLIDFAGQNQFDWCWSLSQHTNVPTSGISGADAIVQVGHFANVANLSVTFASAIGDPRNVSFGMLGSSSAGIIITPGAGFVLLGTQANADINLWTEYAAAQQTVGFTYGSTNAGLIAVEIGFASPEKPWLRQRQRDDANRVPPLHRISEQAGRRVSFRNRIQ